MSESPLVQFKLMLPADLKERLSLDAAQNRRSLSQEIVMRLDQSYDGAPVEESDVLEVVSLTLKHLLEAGALNVPSTDPENQAPSSDD